MLVKLFSAAESGMIQNMILSKSFKQIADLLGCTVEDIRVKVDEMQKENFVMTWQMKLDEKKVLKKTLKASGIKSIRENKVVKIDQNKINNDEKRFIEKQRHEERRRSRSTIPTRNIDYSKMVRVTIDKKTSIYCRPGEEVKAKNEFIQRENKKRTKYEK